MNKRSAKGRASRSRAIIAQQQLLDRQRAMAKEIVAGLIDVVDAVRQIHNRVVK